MSGTSICHVPPHESDGPGLEHIHERPLRCDVRQTRQPLSRNSHRSIFKLRCFNWGAYLNDLFLRLRWDAHQVTLYNQMSWKTALDTIHARLGLCPDAGNGSLQHWKTAIEKACADFRENLPECKPDLFDSLVIATDGRSEGSKFEKLMTHAGRERYGF